MRRLLIATLLLLPCVASADDFASCWKADAPLAPPPTTGSIPPALDLPGQTQQPLTWHTGTHHWVFTTTRAGVFVAEFGPSGTAPTLMKNAPNTANGIDRTVDPKSGKPLLLVTTVNQSGDDVLRILDLDADKPWLSTIHPSAKPILLQPAFKNPDGTLVTPCKTSGVHPDANRVVSTSLVPGLAFVVYECVGNGRGSFDMIDLANQVILLRTELDQAPTGLALDPDEKHLYVTSEFAGAAAAKLGGVNTSPAGAGALLTFKLDQPAPTAPTGTPTLKGVTAVNAGCSPVRVRPDGQKHVHVTARSSNAVFVFNSDLLWDKKTANFAFKGGYRVGTAPVGIEFLNKGALVAIANSDRFNDNKDNDPTTHLPATAQKGSVSIFRTQDALNSLNNGSKPTPCALLRTPRTGTLKTVDFPRDLAVDDQRLYVSLSFAHQVQSYLMSSICP